ncbi:MAG: zinc ribbon domain-containing protein [Turicibacter sp.]|nr:zinc ribbon domain-containing protein [Turicibacter sp.]
MNRLTDAQRTEIRNIFNRHQPMQTRVFEDIQPRKLKNAKESMGRGMGDDEEIFLLYDDTVFGSGKNGVLLTTKGMYARGIGEGSMFIVYDDIASMSRNFSTITVRPKSGQEFKIDANHDTTKATAMLDELTRYMQTEFGSGQSSLQTPDVTASPRNRECQGCGAVAQPNQNFCEYCGSPV